MGSAQARHAGDDFETFFNKFFGAGSAPAEEGPGGPGTAMEPADPGGGASPRGQPDVPPPQPVTPPPIPQFQKPNFYAPKQSQLQKATYDPSSTSHQGLQRFGIATHF